MVNKLLKYCIKEAKKDKLWAKKTIKNKKWLKSASTLSKEMLDKRLHEPVEKIAKDKCDYIKLRSCGKGKYGSIYVWLDERARDEYKKITGKYPNCKEIHKKY